MASHDRLDWHKISQDHIYQKVSGIWYFVGGNVSVREFILALQSGGSVEEFLRNFNQNVTKDQVLAVMKFIQKNTILPIKKFFEDFENARTVEEFLDFTPYTKAEVDASFNLILNNLTA